MAKRTFVDLPAGYREEHLLNLHYAWQEHVPQVYAWISDAASFGELRIKAREDGSVIVVAKGFSSDGTPVVAFGSGYEAISALRGLEGAIAANKWRVDKPWSGGGNGNDKAG